jgi:glucokinase
MPLPAAARNAENRISSTGHLDVLTSNSIDSRRAVPSPAHRRALRLAGAARVWLARRSGDGPHPLEDEARRWEASSGGGADLPAAVAAAAAGGDPLAREALDLWLGAYGSVAGDLALACLSRGGIWLAGGTAAKLLDGLRSPTFSQAFLAKGRLAPTLAGIPIRAITDPAIGSFSAACRARALLG